MSSAGRRSRTKKRSVAVGVRGQGRLGGHGDNARAVFAAAFGQQLLGPESEAGDARRGQQGQLVAALPGQGSDGGAQQCAGVFGGGAGRQAAFGHLRRGRQQAGQVHADERRRRQPEAGKRRVAAADVRVVDEGVPETLRPGHFRQGGIRVGNGDEVAAGGVRAQRLVDQGAEAGVEGQRFGSRARFGGDHKHSARRVDGGGGLRHPSGDGAVQGEHLRIAGGGAADGLPDDFGGEAAAAHTQQDDMAIAGVAHLPPELLQVAGRRRHRGRQLEPGQAVGDFNGAVGPQGKIARLEAGRRVGGVQPVQGVGYRCGVTGEMVTGSHHSSIARAADD